MKQLQNMIEGLLDIDDLEASVEKNAGDDFFIRVLGQVSRGGGKDIDKEMTQIKNLIESLNAIDPDKTSIPKRLRQKDNTAIIYFEHHPDTQTEAFEVRAFVKNPRPYKYVIMKGHHGNWIGCCPRAYNIIERLSRDVINRTIFLGPEAWNEILGPKYYLYLR